LKPNSKPRQNIYRYIFRHVSKHVSKLERENYLKFALSPVFSERSLKEKDSSKVTQMSLDWDEMDAIRDPHAETPSGLVGG